jgi:hypothetical protein
MPFNVFLQPMVFDRLPKSALGAYLFLTDWSAFFGIDILFEIQ